MNIPVEALVWTPCDEVTAGNLWLSKGHWWLIVEAIRGAQSVPHRCELLLTGERAGAMKQFVPGTSGFTLSTAYRWQAVVSAFDYSVESSKIMAL